MVKTVLKWVGRKGIIQSPLHGKSEDGKLRALIMGRDHRPGLKENVEKEVHRPCGIEENRGPIYEKEKMRGTKLLI